jgi:hypothetical protein
VSEKFHSKLKTALPKRIVKPLVFSATYLTIFRLQNNDVVKQSFTRYKRIMEKHIEQHLVREVKKRGGVAYKFSSPSHRGVSDRVVCLPGQTWFVELKQPNGKLSALQVLFAAEMERLNQRYICLWSKEDVDKWLNEVA